MAFGRETECKSMLIYEMCYKMFKINDVNKLNIYLCGIER